MGLFFGFLLFIVLVQYIESRGPQEKKSWKDWYYEDYLGSSHWAKTRNNALVRANFMCQECGSHHKLQVHHLSYKNLWHEEDADLKVVCRECHKDIHHIGRKKVS